MAAKLLHSLAEDNPDLHKQIGCMTGIFQLFDRQNMITGRRISPKRLLPGHSQSNCGNMGSTVHHQEKSNESRLNENVNAKQRVPTESSRDSLSSSSSSSSSVDCNKTTQLEASSFSRINYPGSPSMESRTNQLERQPLDFRNVVKDSMHREVKTSSFKMTEEYDLGHAVKYGDSPRPHHRSKTAKAPSRVAINRKSDIPFDIKESLRVLAKLRDAPWNFNEATGLPRSSCENEAKHGDWNSSSRDSPRLSYDGRERNQLSFESRNFKSNPKMKELPRLSLDSRENSVCGFSSVSVRTPVSKNSQDSSCSTDKAPEQRHSSGNQKRPPSIVAKLMGLETLPDSSIATDTHFGGDSFAKSLESRNPKASSAPHKSSSKYPTSPRWKNPDLITKPIPSSRLPIETAPWGKIDGAQVPKRSAFRPIKGPALISSPSVYGEIEKRLKDLEFKQSGKDLRALKQILEAIQTKALLETRIEEEASNFGIQRDQAPKSASATRTTRLMNQRSRQSSLVVASTTSVPDSSKAYQSPIIIMKPAKFVEKSGVPGCSTSSIPDSSKAYQSPIIIMKPAKFVEKSGVPASLMIPMDRFSGLHKLPNEGFQDSKKGSSSSQIKAHSPKNSKKGSAAISSEKRSLSRNVRLPQTSSKSLLVPEESTTSSIKSTDSVSPRLRQRKVELEKQSHFSAPPSDSNKTRRKIKQKDLNSHYGKIKPKSSNIQQCDDQSSEISNESRTLSYQSDEITEQSDANLSSDTKMDIEVSSGTQSTKIDGSQRQPMKAAEFLVTGSVKKLSMMTSNEDGSMRERDTISLEHPSPVSVLDASLYRDDETCPVKHIISTIKGDDSLDSNEKHGEDQCNLAGSIFDNTAGFNDNLEMDSKKFKNVEDLVQKLRCLNSHHDEAETDYIASLCENTNPDHRYISEILLASGLLLQDLGSGLTSFQLHPSGNPINPELFCVLEKTKGSSLLPKEGFSPLGSSHSQSNTEKLHRKLIFNAVNEMLLEKLALFYGGVPEPWLKPTKLARKGLSGQKILKELCYEIEQFQAKNSKCSFEGEKDDLKNILQDDVMRQSGSWSGFHGEISDVVLDVERLIFKDMVNEIIIW